MANAFPPSYLGSVRHADTIDGFQVPVTLNGPANGRPVIMFDEPAAEADAFDIVRNRLHVAMFRTITIPARPGLSPKSVVGILDRLGVDGGLLVGDRTGGELAWKLAATVRERFTGLVVIDCGHPGVPDVDGVIRDNDCGAVEVDTTVLVGTRAADGVARASRRYVHGVFRLAELAGPRNSRHFTAQLATEIVVRALSR